MRDDRGGYLTTRVRHYVERLQDAGSSDTDACSLDHPPLTEGQLAEAEARLGFTLPPSLRCLYLTVGNGGFGPAYGLLGLVGGTKQEDGHDATEMLEAFRKPDEDDPHWAWPEQLLPVVHLGCAMFFCVDARTEDGRVIWFEPNPHEPGQPWTDSFFPLNISFDELMRRWADGADIGQLMEAAYNSAE